MSLWLFDLGNSRLKCAPWRDGALGATVMVEHDGSVFASGWEAQLPAAIQTAYVASVATPTLTQTLRNALAPRCGHIDTARTLPAWAGVRIAYARPERLGVDRFLALLAARARISGPALIVAVGTALTIDLLDGDGLHRGGRIAPSPSLMRTILHARAPQLPAAGGDYVEFANDTTDALVSGCDGAALGLIQRSLEAARTLLGADAQLLLHGGGAEALRVPLQQAWLQQSKLQQSKLQQNPLPQCQPQPGEVLQALFVPGLVLEGLGQWARECG